MPSSVIKSYEYVQEAETLILTFVSGISYRYFKVPLHIYNEFKNAFAKGIYFNEYIKPNHACERVT